MAVCEVDIVLVEYSSPLERGSWILVRMDKLLSSITYAG